MPGYKITNQNDPHFITFTVVGWVDVFTRDSYRKIIIDSLEYCIKEKGLVLNAYVIMTNHIHIIASTKNEKGLSSIIRDFKSHTSKKIIQELNSNNKESRREWMLRLFKYFAKYNKRNTEYQFWKQDNHPIELISNEWVIQKLDYIHLNPVRGGWVEHPEDFLYSSARNYAGMNSPIHIELLEL